MNNELNVIGLFPIPIASTEIKLPDINLVEWKYEVDFKQSDYNLHTISQWNSTIQDILTLARNFLQEVGYEDRELFITQMWANEYPPGTNITPHVHTNSLLSGCIYFDDSTPTIFYNQRQKQTEMVQIPVENITPYTSEVFTVQAQKGRIVFFPSWLAHSSQPAEQTRTTVSFNIMARELGKPDGFNYVNLYNC